MTVYRFISCVEDIEDEILKLFYNISDIIKRENLKEGTSIDFLNYEGVVINTALVGESSEYFYFPGSEEKYDKKFKRSNFNFRISEMLRIGKTKKIVFQNEDKTVTIKVPEFSSFSGFYSAVLESEAGIIRLFKDIFYYINIKGEGTKLIFSESWNDMSTTSVIFELEAKKIDNKICIKLPGIKKFEDLYIDNYFPIDYKILLEEATCVEMAEFLKIFCVKVVYKNGQYTIFPDFH